MYGIGRLVAELSELGHKVTAKNAAGSEFAVIEAYTVSCGRFTGRVIDLGLQSTADFPESVASAIHVRAAPQLLDVADSIMGVRNITASALGAEWRYWSHNFNWGSRRNARRLMSQVNRIFENA